MGMTHMFEHEKAVFDGIIRRLKVPPLCANKVLQKCCIHVNERGTETATPSCMYLISTLLYISFSTYLF